MSSVEPDQTTVPALSDFLAASAAQVAQVAPPTVIFAAGGTRRRVALAGIAPDSDDYARLSRQHMIGAIGLFFRLGVRHLFMTAIRPGQLQEVGPYRERLLGWVDTVLAGPESLADYRRQGWRARLAGTASVPDLQPTAERLLAETPGHDGPCVWWYVHARSESPWDGIINTITGVGAHSRAEAIKAVYGEDVPPATMYIGFGKPMVGPDLVPPLLMGDLQCYWTQRPGSDIAEETVRRIFYDAAYTRKTWRADKRSRYARVVDQRDLWERQIVLGLGVRQGDFWYPDLL